MPVTWLVSDTHYSHRGILSPHMTRPRPFASIEEHDETLIARWNARIRDDDLVYHVGDFAYGCSHARAREIFDRLRGRKHLFLGNHDEKAMRLPWAEPPVQARRIVIQDPGMECGQGVWLSHYAHRVWDGMWRGDIHAFGHSHGSLPGTARSCDVGVDAWEYRPVRLSEVMEVLAENAAREQGDAAAGILSAAA